MVITTAQRASATCSVGHTFEIQINDPGWAILYERALQRLASGEFRDAVLDAYTALDMYLPTVPIRARYDRDRSLTPNDIARLRKELKQAGKTSERAIAAALAVASVVSGQAPPEIWQGLQTLRNEAVHQGAYPNEEEAERALFEVERLVGAFESLLDGASVGRDPPFRLARQIADMMTEPWQSRTGIMLNTVLGGATRPAPTAKERLAEYKSGDMRNMLLA